MNKFLLSWILLFCVAVSLSSAGYCTRAYVCDKKCTGWWWGRQCTTKYCFKRVCCAGFRGDDCNTDINECAEGSHGCVPPAECVNTHGSYRCDCPAGRAGKKCDIYM